MGQRFQHKLFGVGQKYPCNQSRNKEGKEYIIVFDCKFFFIIAVRGNK